MSLLAALDLAGRESVLLIAPPDSVLAEAGRSSPRPSFVSSLKTAHPALHICWWPERETLTPELLSRLHWLASTAPGEAWLITDPADDDPLTERDLQDALAETNLNAGESRALGGGATALRCLPA